MSLANTGGSTDEHMHLRVPQLPPEMEPGLIHVEVQKGAFLGEAQPVLVMREGPAREQVPPAFRSPH